MNLRSIMAIAGVQVARLKRRRLIWVVAMGPVGIYLLIAGPVLLLQAKLGSVMEGADIPLITWSLLSEFGRILSSAGQLLALVIGALSVAGDLKDGTLFPALAKPVSRFEILTGKLLGSALVVVVFLVVETILLALSMTRAADGAQWDQMFLFVATDMMVYLVWLCCGALAGQLFRPTVGVAFVLGLGVLYSFWSILMEQSELYWYGLGSIMRATFPAIEDMALHSVGANASSYDESAWLRIAYALAWSALFSVVALWRFERRDLMR